MCALLKLGRVFIISYRSLGRSISLFANFSIAMASLLEEDVNVPTRPSISGLSVLALLFGLVAEDESCCSSVTILGIALMG
jgi:hypothetical protein